MKSFIAVLLTVSVAASFAAEWKPLFDGETFEGWMFDTLDQAAPESIWSIKDGKIIVAGKNKPNGVLRTKKSYSDYELEFEWRWTDSGGNSGCLIHCSKPRFMNVWPQSVEVQLMKDNAGDFWLIGETAEVKPEQIAKGKNGKPGRRRINLVDGAENPLGEWNHMRVVARDSSVEVLVNETLVNKAWNLSATEGAICLQAERADIEFRNLRIKEQEAEGWKPLFNGKDLSDFIIEDGKATYEVEDGVITGHTAVPSPNTFLATKAVYGDFELEFETKVSDKLNSGVQIRSRSCAEASGKTPVGRFYGPQVEIEAGPGQAGYIYGEATGRGWLSPEPKSEDPSVNQHNYFLNGQWNHYRILAEGSRIRTFINGIPIADLSDDEIYKTHPKGHIGLQVHSINPKRHPMSVSWRNLRIREL